MARARKSAAAVEAAADQDESVLGDMLDALNGKDSATPTFRLSDDGLSIHLPGVIPTGSEFVDFALGRGGIPQSRISLISGDEGTGKTTLGLQLCANVQRLGGIANYIDAEYKLDAEYAASLGVNNDRLLLSQPESMEDALESIETILSVAAKHNSNRPILIVLDSLNALPTRAELEGTDTPGMSARAMSKGLRRINRRISKQRVALVLISQLRNKIGGVMFGNPNTTGCGKAPRFYSAVIIEMVPIKGIKEAGTKVGHLVKVTIPKNQVGAPYRKAEFVLRFGAGIDWVDSLHRTMIAAEVATPGKSGYATWNDHKWQAANGLRDLLERGGVEQIPEFIAAVRDRYGWNDVPSAAHLPALLAAGAPYAVQPNLGDDEDEDDDGGED